jgi:calcineurin-like phosphoesterase family protein
LHGHSHGKVTSAESLLRLDVGVDAQNFKPISYDEVKAVMLAKTFKPMERKDEEGDA